MATLNCTWADGCTASRIVSAETTGNELERIRTERGRLPPADVGEESRAEDTPLHRCFEWDDARAGAEYRLVQARAILRNIRVVEVGDGEPQKVRAFIRTAARNYEPIQAVVADADKSEEMLRQRRRDLMNWISKYRVLTKVAGGLPEINSILERLGAPS